MDYGSLPSKSPRQTKQKAKQQNKQKNQQLQIGKERNQPKLTQQLQKQYRQWPYPYSKLVFLLVALMIIICSCVCVLTLLIIIKKDSFLASASISFALSSSCQQYLVSKYAAGNYPIQLKVTSVSLAICIVLALILLLILLIKRRTTFCCDQDLIKETQNSKTNSKKQQTLPQQKQSRTSQKANNQLSQLKDKMRKPSYKKQSHYQNKRNKLNQSKQPLLNKQPINQKVIIYRSNIINKFPFKPSYLLMFSILLVFMVIPLGHHLTYYSEWKKCGSYDIDEKIIYVLIGLEGLSIIVGGIAFLSIIRQYRQLKEIQQMQSDDQQVSEKSVSDELLPQNQQPKKEDIVLKNQKQASIQPQPQPKPQLEIQPIKQPKIGQQNPSKVIQTDFDKPKKQKKQKVPVKKQESEDIDEQPVRKNTQEKQVSNNANTGPNKKDNLNLNLKLNLKPNVQQVYDVNISSTSDNKINLSLVVDQDKNKSQSKPQNKKEFKKNNKNQRHRQQDKTISPAKNKQTNPRFNRLSSNIDKKPQSLINQGQAVNNLSNQIIIDSDAKLRKSRTFSIINIQPIIVGQVKIKPEQYVPQRDQLGNEMPLKQGQIVNNDVVQKPLKQQESIKPKQIQMIAMKLVRKSLNFTNSIYSIQQASPMNFLAQNVHTLKEHPALLSGHQSNQKLPKTIGKQKSDKNMQRFDPTNSKNIMSQQQLSKQSLDKVQGLVPQKQQVYGTYLTQGQNQNKQEQNYRSGSSYYHSIKKQINSEHRIIQEPGKKKIGLQIKALDDNSTEEHMKSKISSPINRKSHPNGNSPIIKRQNFFTDIDEEQRQGLQAQSKNKYTKYFEKKKKQFDNTIREQRQKELQQRIKTLEKRQKAIQNKQQDELRDKVIQESIRYLNQNNYNSVLRPLVQQNKRVQQLQKSSDPIIQTNNQTENIQKDNKSVSPNKKGKAKRQKSKKQLYPEIQKNQSRQISRQSFLNGQPEIVVNRDSRQESSQETQSSSEQDELEHQTPLIRKLYRDMKVVKYRQKIFNKTKSQSNIRIQQDQVPIHQPKRSSFSNPKRNIYSPRSKKLYFEQIYQPLSNRFVLLTPKKKQK